MLVGKPLREIQDDTTVLEKTLRDDEDGFDLLPDELLAMILEQVHESDGLSEFVAHVPVRLSHVNRRFRDVALNCPNLWTLVSCFYKSKMLRLFLKRSGSNTGLTIPLWGDPQTRARQWRQLYAFSHRWKKVTVFIHSLTPYEEKKWPFSVPLELPRLDDLYIAYRNYRNFSLPWNTPNISRLFLNDSKFSISTDNAAKILSFTLSMDYYPFIPNPNLIVTELRQMSNLVHLSLSPNFHTTYAGPYDMVELPCLTSLSVTLRQILRTPLRIANVIRAPNLREMSITLHPRGFDLGFDLNSCNDALFLNLGERFPLLQGIRYAVLAKHDSETEPTTRPNDILRFLTGREKLEHIFLENPYKFDDTMEGQFPIVRSLSLDHCHRSINQHLEKILKRSADTYRESNGTRGLKDLDILRCPDIDMAKIREFVPADRITVHL